MAKDDDYAAGDPLPLKGSPYDYLPRTNKRRLQEAHPIDGPEYRVGRDPRSGISKEDFAACGHTRSILEAVRAKCLDCCCQQPMEVRYCTATFCALWPFRMGANPFNTRNLTDEQRAERSERAKQLNAARRSVKVTDGEPETGQAGG